LKIIIFTQGLSRIVKPLVEKYEVVGIVETIPKNYNLNNSMLRTLYKKIKKFIKKDNALTLSDYSHMNNIPYYFMNNGSDKSLENWVKEKNADIIIIYKMSQLLKRNIFEIPKYHAINLHPAYLPMYRGPNPWFWSYYNLDKQGGVTLHFIDDGEDTGDIIYQEKYDIPLGMKSPEMQDLAIGNIGLNLILKALDNIDDLPRQKQPKESPTKKARNIKADEHKNIIDWNNWEIVRIWHLLRGTELWLNALDQPKGIYKGQRWTIENFEKCDMNGYEVAKVYKESNKYFVACKDGKIFLSLKFSLKNFVLNIIRI
jgi:methionyl-tRNA formyltransferase